MLLLSIFLFILCDKFCIGQDEYDALIFAQQWPNTYCIAVKDKKLDSCRLPTDKDIWTIHGIWPTKFGTYGPESCDATLKFDLNTLQPIKDQLERYWPTIEGKSDYGFWRHEWQKHGTCAKLEGLNTQYKYFGQALNWITQYNMAKLLAKNNIIPGNQYSPLDIQKAIKSELNKNPSIRCVTGKETGEIYLKEIYICFNKQLELVDCEGSKNNDNIITNCFTKLISYPSVVSDNTGSNFIYYLSIVVVVVILAILAIVKLSTHLKRNG